MAKAKRTFTIRDAAALAHALRVLSRHHMRHTENGQGKLITKFESTLDLMPDVFVVSGDAREKFRELVQSLVNNQEAPITELERIYNLDSEKGKP